MGLVTTPDNIMCVYIISITLGYFSSIFIVIMSGPRSDIILTPLGGASLSPIYSVALHICPIISFNSTKPFVHLGLNSSEACHLILRTSFSKDVLLKGKLKFSAVWKSSICKYWPTFDGNSPRFFYFMKDVIFVIESMWSCFQFNNEK